MDEARVHGNDDDEARYSEDDHGEEEDGAASQTKRRQARSFNLTTGVVKRTQIGMFRPIRLDHTNCLQVAIKTHQLNGVQEGR
jgi:hypothetical protein